ncbi:ribosome maturation factor RimM [uncultured Ilyobacter sp.]|jgi:16S rRNA processing protein RimM|uniref:ribosome maturation factor RimM n=1 Tax=uncultured Ilyobacter sp. TaxID=544433 RepID=UPI0029C06359|nr:ribosome maturation factor RimM [uncultured Ilyobacter sp.]
MSDLLNVAKISGTHHLKGAVKVVSHMDDIELLIGNKVIVQGPAGLKKVLTVTSAGFMMGNKAVLEFEEITNKVDAAALAGSMVLIKRDLIGIGEDEYLASDLIGMEVIELDGEILGKVTDVFETPAHEIYVVNEGSEEIMIPGIEEFIKDIDFEKRKITVKLIEGMKPEKG